MSKKKLAVILIAGCLVLANVAATAQRSTTENAMVLKPCTPQLFIDYFLRDDVKDTVKVLLCSGNRYLDSVPHDTVTDGWCWYQQHGVSLVLLLKDIEPLHITDGWYLVYCSVLSERGKRVVAVIAKASCPSNVGNCDIYTIENNQWKRMRSFSVLVSEAMSINGEEPNLCKEWLVQRNGRWMYRDYVGWCSGNDESYHFVFE